LVRGGTPLYANEQYKKDLIAPGTGGNETIADNLKGTVVKMAMITTSLNRIWTYGVAVVGVLLLLVALIWGSGSSATANPKSMGGASVVSGNVASTITPSSNNGQIDRSISTGWMCGGYYGDELYGYGSDLNTDSQWSGGMMGGVGPMMGRGGMGGRSGWSNMDRRFIEMMIPHHLDAIDMADLVLKKANHQELKSLASDIKRVQSAEIDQMRAWYKQWYGTEVPAYNSSSRYRGMMPGMGMGMRIDLNYLANADNFDKTFIELMIPHHRMAVMMSNMVLVHGGKAELGELARGIISGQTAEIEKMQTWYAQWYGSPTP
jgi:uncharacterized protein (DUF305 family)